MDANIKQIKAIDMVKIRKKNGRGKIVKENSGMDLIGKMKSVRPLRRWRDNVNEEGSGGMIEK